jgi:hypothetical protein
MSPEGPPTGALLALNRREQVFAGLLATAADLDTDAAVLVVGGVLLALVGADPAGQRAGLGLRTEDAEIRLGLPDEDATGGLAGVGAVQAKTSAADQILHVRLGKVGIRAACARRGAVDAILDAAHKQVTIERARPWVCREHLSNRHVCSFPFERSGEVLGLRLGRLHTSSTMP